MAQDPYRYFRPEARNLLDQFAQGVLELERDAGAGVVQRLLRLAHTLKGAARVVRQTTIAERAHAIEDELAPYREGAVGPARETIDTVLAHLDEISSRIVTLAPPEGAPGNHRKSASEDVAQGTAANEAAANPLDASRVVRAETADMDTLLEGVSEMHARLIALRRNADAIKQVGHLADLLHAQVAAQGGNGCGRAGGAQNRLASIAEELRRKAGGVAGDLETSISQADRELRQVRDTAESLRLVSIGNVLTALKRIARDAARSLSKQVTFDAAGGDIRLDADVLGVVQAALIQIIRNAVAHGIETESERAAAGKPVAGSVTVNVSQRGSRILFACRDDGRGIDLAAVKKAAVARGLLDAEGSDLTAEDLVRVLLRGGISTSGSVTDVSGRGVGLDVVRDALERLGGDIAVQTTPGAGTTFELVIPRSVSSLVTLFVEAEDGCGAVAIPLDSVCRVIRVAASDVACASSGASILYEGKAIPFVPLAALLGETARSAGSAWTAIVVAGAKRVAAIGIARLIGTARTVVRPLPGHLSAAPIVAGTCLDGEGNPQLVLDPESLAAAADGAWIGQSDVTPEKLPVLVVDDSLTTRMLEKSILESAGYEVEVASSGEQALDIVRHKPFALILCDVEMPGIDGFSFVQRIRADAALRDIPAILVTSRSEPQDRQRGRDVGAHGYIVKSEFNQAELLAMIKPMVC